MNFPGYNPSMFNNMNMDQMKMASDMLSGMSDEQLAGYAKMMGMPNMDPSMLRNSAGMMKGMNEHQFSQMKDQAKNFKPPGGFGGASPSASTSQTTSTPTNTSTSQTTTTSTRYGHIEKLKNKGNDLFKKGTYGEAATAYFEAIIEIEEIKSGRGNSQDDELDNLEVSCRLNYANVKAKENEYDVVLTQAKAVLKVKENGKAYFRLGQALYHFKKYEEALKNLETAVSLLPGDDTVADYRNKARKEVEAVKAQTATENKPKEEKETSSSSSKVHEESREKPAQEDTTTKPKMKKKAAPEVDIPIAEKKPAQANVDPTFDYLGSLLEEGKKEEKTEKTEKTEKKEVVIEEEKVTETKPSTTSSRPTTTSAPSYPNMNYPAGMTEDKIKQGQEQLGNMNPDQMKMMADYFKNMDNASLKSMLKMQSGMDVSDEQLQSMKMMMTPEMLQNFSKMDLGNMPKFPNQPTATPSTTSTTTTTASASTGSTTQPQAQAQPQFPMGGMGGMAGAGGMPNIDMGSDQIQMMLDMVVKNPEMLKNMVGMLGEDNPVAKFLKNKSPETLATYVKVAQKLLKVYGKVSPLVKILRQYWQLIMGILIGYIVYRIVS